MPLACLRRRLARWLDPDQPQPAVGFTSSLTIIPAPGDTETALYEKFRAAIREAARRAEYDRRYGVHTGLPVSSLSNGAVVENYTGRAGVGLASNGTVNFDVPRGRGVRPREDEDESGGLGRPVRVPGPRPSGGGATAPLDA